MAGQGGVEGKTKRGCESERQKSSGVCLGAQGSVIVPDGHIYGYTHKHIHTPWGHLIEETLWSSSTRKMCRVGG